jgi:hypothetical protein
MIVRLFPFFVLLAVALIPSGCASSDDTTADDPSTFQATPEKPEDSHGWGANIQGLSGNGRQ